MGLLELKDIRLTLDGKPILNGINADIWENHVHAIVGPNGAGKSTLAGTIMGLAGYRGVTGSILYKGEDITGMPVNERARRGITLGWQDPARFEGLTIEDFIMVSAETRDEKVIYAAMEKVGLNPCDFMHRALDKTLSGGERKRIELASIIVMEPALVILDEPDSGIDVQALELIFDAIRHLKAGGSTIILITHSLTVLKQADHAFLLCHGKIIEKGPIDGMVPYFEKKCIACTHINHPELGEVPA